jgi:hypothetical protein
MFLLLFRYNVTVKSNLYAKYYFELRALFKDNEKEFPLKPLEKLDAVNLELNSMKYKDSLETENKKSNSITTGSFAVQKKEWMC